MYGVMSDDQRRRFMKHRIPLGAQGNAAAADGFSPYCVYELSVSC